MNGLGLSAEALERRKGYLCAGDAAAIMAGHQHEVWQIKRGLIEEPPFYDTLDWFIKKHVSREEMDLRCQLGLLTEPYNLAYCQERTSREITYYSSDALLGHMWNKLTGKAVWTDELQVSRDYPFMACHLDGMTKTAKGELCVVDAKWTSKADEATILRYTAAGVHQATVMGVDWWALSIFIGNGKWELIEQEVDPFYRAELIATERRFWDYVVRGEEPPEQSAAVLPPKPQPKLRNLHVPADGGEVFQAMCRQENWLQDAIAEIHAFVGTDAATKRNGIARSKLRDTLIPADIGEFEFGRFTAKRSKAGALTMTVALMGDDDAI